MMQAESLLKNYNDVKASIARRMDLFFASGMKPMWISEEKLVTIMFKCHVISLKEIVEIFKKLGLWENMIVHCNLLNMKYKVRILSMI